MEFEQVVAFHGHACPGLAFGFRVAGLVLAEMGGRASDEELVAVVENNSCAVDAIQVMLGCTFGKGNLLFRDYGKQVYTFLLRPGGDSLRVAVNWEPPPESEETGKAWEAYARGDRTEAVLKQVRARRNTRLEAILAAADRDLFTVSRGRGILPAAARIFPSVACGFCGEKVMEPRARVRNGLIACIPCVEHTDRR